MEDWEIKNTILDALEEHGEFQSISSLQKYLKDKGVDISYYELRKVLKELEGEGYITLKKEGRRIKVIYGQEIPLLSEEMGKDIEKAIEETEKEKCICFEEEYAKVKRKIIKQIALRTIPLIVFIILLFFINFWLGLGAILGIIAFAIYLYYVARFVLGLIASSISFGLLSFFKK